MILTECQIKALYNILLYLMAIISTASFVAIWANEELTLDLSSNGFNNFLDTFRFTLTALGTFLILLGGKIAIISLEKTAQANLFTSIQALRKDFIEYQ